MLVLALLLIPGFFVVLGIASWWRRRAMKPPRSGRRTSAAGAWRGPRRLHLLRRAQAAEPTDEKPKEKVFTLDRAKVKALTLAPQGGEAIRLVKEKDGWRMTAPSRRGRRQRAGGRPALQPRACEVDEVVTETPARPRRIRPRQAEEHGRASPSRAPRSRWCSLLGDKTPDGGGLYAKRPRRPASSPSPSYVEGRFDKKPFDLRDRDLLHVKRDAVQTSRSAGPRAPTRSPARQGRRWAFTQPLPPGRPLVGGRPAGQPRDPAHGLGGRRGCQGPEALRPRQAARTVTLGPRRRHAQDAARSARPRRTRSTTSACRDRPLVAVIPGALVDDWPRAWPSCGPSACSRSRPTR